jgi:oxygen-independent coproporphyrinogen-3 oxidase
MNLPTIDTSTGNQEATGLGNYFVANYPPFSFWKPEYLPEIEKVLDQPPAHDVPLGLYLHIPFCRKRCKFCYFRVYTDKNARDVESYVTGLMKELELYAARTYIGRRQLHYIYFGGGTPSYLSARQLQDVFAGIKQRMNWDHPAEVTFECEPGTLQRPKLEALKELGVTRLSLGIENFQDRILEINGRAHRSPEIFRAYGWCKELGFEQINIDLIAGMVGETWDNWKDCIRQTIEIAPESVTIYQMELPYNTVFSREMRKHDGEGAPDFADWPTKRAWMQYAFDELKRNGYDQSSAYTMVRRGGTVSFVYRDALWHGADLIGSGVASFGHLGGVHVQNLDQWDSYLGALNAGRLPFQRALRLNNDERLIRELILQLKTGRVERSYFHDKFGIDIADRFKDAIGELNTAGFTTQQNGTLELTPAGYLQVDKQLPAFFLPHHRGVRYT